jgi:hypothetical protein
MEPIEQYFSLENMLTLGVLTGSRAFNCASEDSDWDIVITYKHIFNTHLIPSYKTCIDFSKNWNEPQYDADGLECIQDMYDRSVWGPISEITKYTDLNNNTINLFIYYVKYESTLPLFTELNNRMNFLYSSEVHDRDTRIDRFIQLTDKLGISNFKG